MTDFLALGDERFISLTTFRRTGEAVATPVWVVPDGDALLVTTPSASGKVKRLRHTARVELRPCSRNGTVDPDARTVGGRADIVDEDRPELFRAKYGLEYRTFLLVERVLARGRNRSRVGLRITG